MRKNIWLAFALVMMVAVVLFTFGCAKEVAQSQPGTSQAEVQNPPDRSATETEPAGPRGAEASAHESAEKAFLNDNIHFAFDSSALSDEARQLLNNKAEYLRTNSGLKITVEGHCDDRGTGAYNMALGERRAESVRTFLVNLGISPDRLSTISYGEERPISMGQNEASWANNRRAQFVTN